MAKILIYDYNCIIAYNLDGGGSAQLIWDGLMINCPTDASLGTVERRTPDLLYIAKEITETRQEEKLRKGTLLCRKFMGLINELKNYGVKKCVTDGSFEI